ncbi:MAG: hypothetical protein Tsb0019_35140 [Roseibium sp.]
MPRSLIKLALEGTAEARQRLFAQVSELVIGNIDERTERELAIFSEVIIRLYCAGAAGDRARLAQKLGNRADIPVELARRIAEDDVSVAVPVLASCPVFSQDDLLDFAERLDMPHLQVLARRTDLSLEVSDAIAARGDLAVHRILTGNREIRLSRETMLTLVRHAADDAVLREDLALRSDLSPAVCRALMPLVSDEVKKRLQRTLEGSLSQEQLDQIARLKVLRREFGAALENSDMTGLWREAEQRDITVNELMILLLQDGRFDHATELLSSRGRTALTPLKDAVYNGKQDLVLKTAAKAGLDIATFALFVKVRSEHLKEPAAQGSVWTASYRKHIESAARQSRCGDFQANRSSRKGRPAADRGARLATA